MCDVWKNNRELDELPARLVEKHKSDLQRLEIKRVILTGGEPLMHGNLWRICRIFKDLGIHITLESSGLLLSDHAAEIVEWIDTVVVPLEGTESVHDRIRNSPGAYRRLAEGVRQIRDIDQDQAIIARSVVQKINYPYLPEIIAAAGDLQLDGIELVPIDVQTRGYNLPETIPDERLQELRLRSVDVLIFNSIIDRIRKDFSEELEIGFIRGGILSLLRLVDAFDRSLSSLSSHDIQCNVPWHSVVIDATGRVKPCPFHRSLGSIRKNGLRDILNSPEAISFRENLDPSTDPICTGCTAQKMFDPSD